MTIEVKIDVIGDDEIKAIFGALAKGDFLQRPLANWAARMRAQIADYPPTLPNQRYVRTGTLGRGWVDRVSGSGYGVKGVVGNAVSYAPRVQGAGTQEPIFAGRWKTDAEVLARNKRAIEADVLAEVNRVLAGNN